jgi:hypothetical protein
MIEHLTKEELLDKVSHAAQIFKHDAIYSLDVKWNADTGVINLTIIAEIK